MRSRENSNRATGANGNYGDTLDDAFHNAFVSTNDSTRDGNAERYDWRDNILPRVFSPMAFGSVSVAIVIVLLVGVFSSVAHADHTGITNTPVQKPSKPKESLRVGTQDECFKLEWSYGGMRVKNRCKRNISDMWICLAKNDRKTCRTNWNHVGRINAGKTIRLSKMPRHKNTYWFWKACFEPAKVIIHDDGRYSCE